jgi:hypothetical protein
VATTDILIVKRYQPYGTGWWLRPDLRTLVTEQQALAEVAALLEPAEKDEHRAE